LSERENSAAASTASCALEPLCSAIVFPAMSFKDAMPLSFRTTSTCAFFKYGFVNVSACSRSFVIVKPFQMQSILPVFSSISFAPQSMGCALNSTPSRFATSFAKSIS